MIEIRPATDAARDIPALAPLQNYAFGIPTDHAETWLAAAGLEHLRLAEEVLPSGARTLVGGLIHIPMGHFVGGRSVPTVGIAGVAVAPEARGRGVAKALMSASLREAAERGVPLSSLYPATLTLYRSVGYEIAGSRMRFRMRVADLADLTTAAGTLGTTDASAARKVRREEPGDELGVAACYQRFAQHQAGWLDRGPYVWRRTERYRSQISGHRFVALDRGNVAGYVRLALVRNERAFQDIHLLDFASLDPVTTRVLTRLVADHRSTAEQLTWFGGLDDPIAQLARERVWSTDLHEWWMVRILHVPIALEARGYPAGLDARLVLAVEDELFEHNHARFELVVRDGRARCGRVSAGAGAGEPRIAVRGLAALYTGFATPYELAARGLLAGDDDALAALAAVFPKAAPSMRDMF